jgi:hypothetical protein
VRGIAGIAVALALGLMLAIQKGETRHWKKQSGQYETLYHGEQVAHRRPSPIIAPRPTRRARPTEPTPSAGESRAGRNQRKDHQ